MKRFFFILRLNCHELCSSIPTLNIKADIALNNFSLSNPNLIIELLWTWECRQTFFASVILQPSPIPFTALSYCRLHVFACVVTGLFEYLRLLRLAKELLWSCLYSTLSKPLSDYNSMMSRPPQIFDELSPVHLSLQAVFPLQFSRQNPLLNVMKIFAFAI